MNSEYVKTPDVLCKHEGGREAAAVGTYLYSEYKVDGVLTLVLRTG